MKKFIICVLAIFISFMLLYQTGCAQSQGFTLKDMEGRSVSLSDFLGKEVVLLVFSTTWCPYCVKEIPELARLHRKYDKKGLKVLAVYIQESRGKLEGFIKKHNIPYTILLDLDGAVAREYKVRGVPSLLLIDKNGNVVKRDHKSPDEALIKELVD